MSGTRPDGEWKKGSGLSSGEIVTLAGSLLHGEYAVSRAVYLAADAICRRQPKDQFCGAAYHWRYKGRWNGMAIKADSTAIPCYCKSPAARKNSSPNTFGAMPEESGSITNEYQVAHPRWDIYPVREYQIDCDFSRLVWSRHLETGLAGTASRNRCFWQKDLP